MLKASAFFLITALVAAVMAFGNVTPAFEPIAKVLFFILVILFLLSLFFKRNVSH